MPVAACSKGLWRVQVFEPRRFVELRKQSFWKQVRSGESLGMGLFYTLNVFFIQSYLGMYTRRPY